MTTVTSTMSSLLDFKTGEEYKGRLILLSDAITDGAFLMHHFLQDLLKRGHRVILVSLLHSFLHYSSVAAKFGVNLRKKKEDGLLVFVDGLSDLLTAHFTSVEDSNTTSDNSVPSDRSVPAVISDTSVSGIRGESVVTTLSLDRDLKVGGAVSALESLLVVDADSTCILMDDLSVLLNVGVSLKDVMLLVQRCFHLLTECKKSGCLVVGVHQEGVAGCHSDEELLHRHLLHMCHLHCHAHGLATGYSRDVHGDLTVTWRDPNGGRDKPLPPQQTAQYKLTDRTVQVFARGLSTAIL